MKRPFFYSAVVLISLFLCTGCFDLDEYILLKKDGSGRFSFVVDMSKMMAMASMFDSGSDTTSQNESDKLSSSFERSKKKILTIPGISNYKEVSDTVNYKFGLAFDFQDITALNKALNYVFAPDSSTTETNYTYFELKNNILNRLEPTDVKNLISQSSTPSAGNAPAGSPGKSLFNFDMVFSDITYNTMYEFEQSIDSVSNPGCLLSPTGNKVLLTCHPFAKDSVSASCSLRNSIFLK